MPRKYGEDELESKEIPQRSEEKVHFIDDEPDYKAEKSSYKFDDEGTLHILLSFDSI